MTSDHKAVEFALRRIAPRMGLALVEDDGQVAFRTGLTTSEPEGIRFRVHNAGLGQSAKMASCFVPIEAIRRGADRLVEAIELQLALAASELGPRPHPMSCKGTFRVHFNRHGAAPLVWSVATDQWELAVASVAIAGAEVRTAYKPKATPDDEDGKASAWLEVTGVLTVAGGEARITRSAG